MQYMLLRPSALENMYSVKKISFLNIFFLVVAPILFRIPPSNSALLPCNNQE